MPSRFLDRLTVAFVLLVIAGALSFAAPSDDRPDPHSRERLAAPRGDAVEGASLGPQGEPLLLEVLRVDFDPPVSKGGHNRIAVTPRRSYFFAGNLEVVIQDRESGQVEGSVVLFDATSVSNDPFRYASQLFALHTDKTELLVVTVDRGYQRAPRFRVYDVTDAKSPLLLREESASLIANLRPLPVPGLALSRLAPGSLRLQDVASGLVLAESPGDGANVYAASGVANPLIVATLGSALELQVWDLTDLAEFRLVGQFSVPTSHAELSVSPRGRAVAYVTKNPSGNLASVQVFDVANALAGAVIPLSGVEREYVALADGATGPVLAISRSSGLTLYDVSDVASPRELAVVDAVPRSSGNWDTSPPLVAAAAQPWIAAVDTRHDRLVVVDADSGAIVAARPTPGYAPQSLAIDEGAHLEVAAIGRLYDGGIVKRDGPGAIFNARIDGNGSLQDLAVYRSEVPTNFTDVETSLGRYVATYDEYRNVLLLLDAAGSEPVQALHPPLPRGSGSTVANLDGRGSHLLLATTRGETDRAMTIFDYDVGSGRFEEVFRWAPSLDHVGRGLEAVYGRENSIHMLGPRGLLSRSASGVETPVPIAKQNTYSHLEVSADETRALLQIDWFAGGSEDIDFAIVDISDPDAPGPVVTSEGGIASTPRFVDGGRAVLASVAPPYSPWYEPRLYDGWTAEPLSATGDRIGKFFFHGAGEEFGDDRFAFWNWTWSAWETAVVDFSVDPPTLLGISPFEHEEPSYVARPGRDDAYMIARIDEYGSTDSTNVWLVTSDGRFVPRGEINVDRIVPLRHGFLAGVATYPRAGIVVLRDPELNRAPVVDAGPDLRLECEAGGADVILDGRASFDPDSTPGTTDDVVALSWEVDGRFVSDQLVGTDRVSIGEHVAALTIEDALGASTTDIAIVAVVDTQAPEVDLHMRPALANGLWPRDTWYLDAPAADACDGDLEARVLLDLEAGVFELPLVESPGALSEIRVLDRNGERVVELAGDLDIVRAAWQRARIDAGLTVAHENPVKLQRAASASPGPAGDLVAAYRLDARGQVDAAFTAGADHRLRATARDAAGLEGVRSEGFSTLIDEFCATLPAWTGCRSASR